MSDFITKFKNFLTGGEEIEEVEFEGEENFYGEEYSNEYGEVDNGDFVKEENIMDKWNFSGNDAGYESISEPTVAPTAQAVTTPVYQQPSATVVMLSPYDIRTSQVVCDHIREGHIVICNLTPNANNQRVVDYISGAVFALDGKIEPTPVKTTFVCTPKQVELIVDSAVGEESQTKVSAL